MHLYQRQPEGRGGGGGGGEGRREERVIQFYSSRKSAYGRLLELPDGIRPRWKLQAQTGTCDALTSSSLLGTSHLSLSFSFSSLSTRLKHSLSLSFSLSLSLSLSLSFFPRPEALVHSFLACCTSVRARCTYTGIISPIQRTTCARPHERARARARTRPYDTCTHRCMDRHTQSISVHHRSSNYTHSLSLPLSPSLPLSRSCHPCLALPSSLGFSLLTCR